MISNFWNRLKTWFYDLRIKIFPKRKARSTAVNKRSGLLFYIAFMALPVLQFCVMYIGVNFNSLLLAFQDYDMFTGKFSFVGFQNFRYVFDDITNSAGILSTSLKNSLIVYGVALLIQEPLGLFFAFYIYKKKPLSEVFRVILFLPSIISVVVLATLYKIIVSSGYVEFMSFFGVEASGLLSRPNTIFPTIIVYNVWTGFGMSLLVYTSAMSQVPSEVTEAAMLDGVTPMREFFSIVLPQIFPTFATFLTVSIVGIFTNQANLYTFYRDNADPAFYTIGYYLFIKVMGDFSTKADYPQAAAMGVMFSFIAVPITLFIKKFLEYIDPNNDARFIKRKG